MAEIITLVVVIVMIQKFISGVKEAGKQSGRAPSSAAEKTVPAKQVRHETQGLGRKMESASGRIRRKQEAVPNVQKVQPKQEFTFGDNSAPSAMRLIEGDSIPQGCNMVKCSYCGAENLVSKQHPGRYACYFCREIL